MRPPTRAIRLTVTTVLMCAGMAACDGGDDVQNINLDPATHEEAAVSLSQLEQHQKADPNNPALPKAYAQLQARLDQLNHLVARAEPEPGRFVSFYEPEDGSVFVSESGPKDGKQLLTKKDLQGTSLLDLYRRLARAEPPEALVRATLKTVPQDAVGTDALEIAPRTSSVARSPVTTSDGITTVTRGLTEANGPWYENGGGCYGSGEFGGDYTGCRGNETGTIAWAEANAKTSFFNVAIVRTTSATVRLKISTNVKLTDTVAPGEWKFWWGYSSKYTDFWTQTQQYNRRVHTWEILNIAGDLFDWAWAFKWTCTGIYNCNLDP